MCIVGMIGMNGRASEGTIFHVENQKGNAGETVTVPVEMKDGKEVGGFEITVYYDSETLEFQDLQKGDLVEEKGGLFDYYHNVERASVKIVYVVADTVKSEGTIANLTFKLKKDCESTLPIGMGVDEVIDNSEESKQITGKVSGVDETFQKQVDVQRTEEAESLGEGTEGNVETGEKENTSQLKENKTAASEKTESVGKTKRGNRIYMAVVCVIVAAGVILTLIIFKARKNREK